MGCPFQIRWAQVRICAVACRRDRGRHAVTCAFEGNVARHNSVRDALVARLGELGYDAHDLASHHGGAGTGRMRPWMSIL